MLGLASVGLTGETLRGLIAGLDRELETLLSDEKAANTFINYITIDLILIDLGRAINTYFIT